MMFGYQIGATIREIYSLRLRAVLLILQVAVAATTLAGSLHDAIRGFSDLSVARRLDKVNTVYFTIYYDSMKPFRLSEELNQQLTTTLDGSSADYAIVKNNYFEADHLSAPMLVAVGGFAQAYQLPVADGSVAVGAEVVDYEVGDVVTLGSREFTISTRLPPKAAYLDPAMGYESLDEHLVLLSSYKDFAANTEPGFWQEELVWRTVLFDPSSAEIDAYVRAAASSGAIDLVPHQLRHRIAATYEKGIARSSMFLVFFGCLLLVLLGTIIATLDTLVSSNLRRYQIEILQGAHFGHILARINLFLAIVFSGPTLCLFGAVSMISPMMRPLPMIILVLMVIMHVVLSVRVLATLKRSDPTLLLRRQDD